MTPKTTFRAVQKAVITMILLTVVFGGSIHAQSISGDWKLTSIIIESDMAYSIIAPITVRFDGDGKISGNGGCNSFTGKYSFRTPKKPFTKPVKITFTDIISTTMACDKTSTVENVFFRSLKEAATVILDKEELIIKNKATFVKAPHGNVLIQNSMSFVRDAK